MEKDQFLELLHEQQSSGLSIKAYCEAHSIALSTFFFGKHRFLSSPSSEDVSCAAGWMATICSLIGTCKEQNINPRLYLNDVIAKMPYLKSKTENDKDIFQLLPQNWIVSHPEACIGATQQ